jgi:hypothetical protein
VDLHVGVLCEPDSESAHDVQLIWCRDVGRRRLTPRTWAMWRICGISKAEPVLFGGNLDDDFVSCGPLLIIGINSFV